MIALDGNAIAGDLFDVFGVELTTARFSCAACGAASVIAETVVYLRGPGRVVRCRACGGLLAVFVTIRGVNCVDLLGMDGLGA